MNKYLLCSVYIGLIVLANWSVGAFGPWITPINAFLLIGTDFVIRDRLNLSLNNTQVFSLILVSALLTFLCNVAPTQIAVASALSFLVSQLVDYIVFSLISGKFAVKSFTSNVFGAAVDSTLFPLIAFGVLMPEVSLLQFVCKVAGASVLLYIFIQCAARKEYEKYIASLTTE